MDIMVEGKGTRYYRPDQVVIRLNFYTKTKSYETALEEGTRDVQVFIEKVLEQMQFSKEDLKTKNFRVYEEIRYDHEKKKEIKCGFVYTQGATLKVDYDINIVADFMDRVSKLKNPPKYTIEFNVKNEQESINEVMAEAYNKAKEKAEAIAKSAGKTLKECVKVDFRPFEERVYSRTTLGSGVFGAEMSNFNIKAEKMSTQDIVTKIFTPEDIEISETLYCLWVAE